jgi:ATP synthase protein I
MGRTPDRLYGAIKRFGSGRGWPDGTVAEQRDKYIKNRAAAFGMLAVEAGIAAASALLLNAFWDTTAGKSALLGGLVLVIPNALFVGYALRRSADQGAATALRRLYVGEALKLGLTVVLFAACFVYAKPLNPGVFLATYAILLAVNLVGTARIVK